MTSLRGPQLDDNWPHYPDADVHIIVSPERTYHLNSRILCANIAWFRLNVTDSSAAHLSSKLRKQDHLIRWRVELRLPFGSQLAHFVLNPLDSNGRPRNAIPPAPFENGLPSPHPCYQHFDNLLRAAYHQPLILNISGSTSMNATVNSAVSLLTIAEPIGATRCVASPIDCALISQGQSLLRAIAVSPCQWAELSVRLKSEFIFAEALCHAVGQFNVLSKTAEFHEMDQSIQSIVYRKVALLNDIKTAVEMRIMGHYDPALRKPEGSLNVGPGSVTTRGKGTPTRATVYQQDIFSWMAMNLLRHWLGQYIVGDRHRHAPDGGYSLYTALAAGGNAYAEHESIEAFCRTFPLSSKARTRFEEVLDSIKDSIKPFVVPLVANKSMLDVQRWPQGYLTCTETYREDFPWIKVRESAGRPAEEFNRGVQGHAKMLQGRTAKSKHPYNKFESSKRNLLVPELASVHGHGSSRIATRKRRLSLDAAEVEAVGKKQRLDEERSDQMLEHAGAKADSQSLADEDEVSEEGNEAGCDKEQGSEEDKQEEEKEGEDQDEEFNSEEDGGVDETNNEQ